MKREYQIITNRGKFRIKSRLWIFGRPLWWKTERETVDSIDMAVMYEPVEFRTIADAEAWIDGKFSHTNERLSHEPNPNDRPQRWVNVGLARKGPPL